MVSVINNVTRSMNVVTCYAENGYGSPSEASRRVAIGRRPNITAPLITFATLGDDVTLDCEVDAHPAPQVYFSRDADGAVKISSGTKHQVTLMREGAELDSAYILRLKISAMEQPDSGVYFCGANNTFGSISQVIKIQSRQKSVRFFFILVKFTKFIKNLNFLIFFIYFK